MQHASPRSPSPALSRAIAIGAVLAGTAAALAGCASSGDDKSTELTVQAQSEQIEALQAVADEFEKDNPGVTVTFQTLTNEQKITTNGQILAGNNAPDLGIVPLNAQSYTDLVAADALLPLDDVWKQSDLASRYGETTASSLSSGGTPYLVLFDRTFYNTIFYNKDAFSAAGVTVPADRQITSHDELYAIVDALKEKGYEGLATGGNDGYKWGWLLDAQLFANTPPAALENLTTSWQPGAEQTVPYTSPEFTDSVAQLQDWYDHGVFPEGVLAQSDDQSLALFNTGKAAMFLGGAFSPPSIDGEVSFEYDWLLLPGMTADAPTIPTIYSGDTFAIPKTAKNPDLAKKFLELLLTDEIQAQIAETNGSLPAVDTVDASMMPSLNPMVQSIVSYVSEHGSGTGWTSVVPGGLAQSFFDPQMQKVLSGTQTVTQLGENQQAQFEDFVSSNG